MLFETLIGRVLYEDAKAQCFVFWCPTRKIKGKEMHINIARRERKLGVRQNGSSQAFPTFEGSSERHGMFYKTTYDIEPGTLLKVFALTKAGFKSPRKQSVLYLQAREDAPYNRMVMPLPDDAGVKLTFSELYIKGRYDILSLKDVEMLGTEVQEEYRKVIEMDDYILHIEELQGGTPRPKLVSRKLVDEEGVEHVITAKARRRSIEL